MGEKIREEWLYTLERKSIHIGALVRLTEKPDVNGVTYNKKPIVGILANMRLEIGKNGERTTILGIVFTEPVEENSNGMDFISINDIEKIELLEEPPESLHNIIMKTEEYREYDLLNDIARSLYAIQTEDTE